MQVATPNSSTPSSIAAAAAAAVAAIGSATNQGPTDSTMTQLILEHPLYPLLQMVFQKCELATSSPRDSQAETICSSDSFSEDIRNFINEARLRNLSLTTGCHDVDKFMLKSIEGLRIHLLELEKVHQLCDNFCQRYINCLKGKLPIDLVVDDGSSRDTNSTSRNGQLDGGPSTTPNNNNNQNSSSSNTSQNGQQTSTTASSASNNGNNQNNSSTATTHQQNNGHSNNSNHHHQQNHHTNNHHLPHQQAHPHELGANGYPAASEAAAAAAAYAHQSYGSYGATGYAAAAGQNPYAAAQHAAYAAGQAAIPHYQAAGDHHSASLKHDSSNNHHHHNSHHRELTASSGSSSASSVKMEHAGQGGGGGAANGGPYATETSSATTAPDRQLHDDVRSPTGSTGSFLGDASMGSGDGTECEDDDNRGRRQQKKRGIFPKAATNIMRAWLFQHLNHPYPSEDQKKQLAEETHLTILQVNNWFINARRRIVQPMIDQSNRTSGNIMAGGPAYSPDAAGMGYMLDGSQPFRSLPGVDSAGGMNPLAASHAAAMTSAAMGAYSAASAQHLSQYGRQQQSHAAMLGLSTPPTGPHMMGAHPTLPPHDYY